MTDRRFSILVICTGNVCRSPAVERMLAQGLGASVAVSSAGTHALVDEPISTPMAHLLAAQKIDGDDFRARLLSERLLKAADLVLPVTRAHRSLAVEMWPAAVRRSFTVREFARLLSRIDISDLPRGTPAVRLRAAIPLAAAQRGRALVKPEDDDVIDPYRQPDAVYRASFEQMVPAVETIVRVATGSASLDRSAEL